MTKRIASGAKSLERPIHIPDHKIGGLLPRGNEARERFENAYNHLHEIFQRLDNRFTGKG